MEPSEFTLTGPLFVGNLLGWFLLGSLMIQIYSYGRTYYCKDRRAISALVYILLVLELVQTVLTTHYVWGEVVVGSNHPEGLTSRQPWSAISIPVIDGLIAAVVQCFFAWRIWALGGQTLARVAASSIVTIALLQCTSAFVLAGLNNVQFYRAQSQLTSSTSIIEVWLAGSFSCDILIAVSMIAFLLPAKTNVGFKSTEALVDRLIFVAIETGLVTTVVAGVDLALYLRFPKENIHLCFALILGKVYSNVLLVNLNGRKRIAQAVVERRLALSNVDIELDTPIRFSPYRLECTETSELTLKH